MNLGVVIPAYNAEKTIKRCLDSVLSNRNVVKVIIVDDGSSDKTQSIVLKFAEEDTRVQIITGKNNGPSFARCIGLKNLVNGGVKEYSKTIPELADVTIKQKELVFFETDVKPVDITHITFVDSDDYLEHGFYDHIKDEVDFDDVDVLEFGWVEEDVHSKVNKKSSICRQVMFGSDILLSFMRQGEGANFLWNKIFSLRVLNRIVWSGLYAGEDYLILLQALKKSGSYRKIENRGYHYVKSNTSLTSKRVNAHSHDNIYSMLIAESVVDEELKDFVYYKECAISALMYYSFLEAGEPKSAQFYRDMFYRKYLKIRDKKLKPLGSKKRLLLVRLFGLSPSFCTKLIKYAG